MVCLVEVGELSEEERLKHARFYRKDEMKKVKSYKMFNILGHIPRDHELRLKSDYSLFKLDSGNLLCVGARSGTDTDTIKGFSIEICPKTLKGLNTWVMEEGQAEYDDDILNFSEFYQVDGDLLVSVIGQKNETEEEEKTPTVEEVGEGPGYTYRITTRKNFGGRKKLPYGLALWDKKLNLLDTTFEFLLSDLKSILTVDHQLVTAKGAEDNILLFEIDSQAKKINVKKNLLSLSKSHFSVIEGKDRSQKGFKCWGRNLLLTFNSQLELMSWTDNYEEKYENR